MDREAARLDKAGRHADAKRVRIAARGRKGEANPLPIEAFLPALNSGGMWCNMLVSKRLWCLLWAAILLCRA